MAVAEAINETEEVKRQSARVWQGWKSRVQSVMRTGGRWWQGLLHGKGSLKKNQCNNENSDVSREAKQAGGGLVDTLEYREPSVGQERTE